MNVRNNFTEVTVSYSAYYFTPLRLTHGLLLNLAPDTVFS